MRRVLGKWWVCPSLTLGQLEDVLLAVDDLQAATRQPHAHIPCTQAAQCGPRLHHAPSLLVWLFRRDDKRHGHYEILTCTLARSRQVLARQGSQLRPQGFHRGVLDCSSPAFMEPCAFCLSSPTCVQPAILVNGVPGVLLILVVPHEHCGPPHTDLAAWIGLICTITPTRLLCSTAIDTHAAQPQAKASHHTQ